MELRSAVRQQINFFFFPPRKEAPFWVLTSNSKKMIARYPILHTGTYYSMVGNIFKNYQQRVVIQSLFSSACDECGLFLQAMTDDKHHKERWVDSIGIRLPAGGRKINQAEQHCCLIRNWTTLQKREGLLKRHSSAMRCGGDIPSLCGDLAAVHARHQPWRSLTKERMDPRRSYLTSVRYLKSKAWAEMDPKWISQLFLSRSLILAYR